MELPNVKTFHEPHHDAFFFGPERSSETFVLSPDDIQPESTFEKVKQQLLFDYEECVAVFAKEMAAWMEGRYDEYVEGRFSTFKHTFLIRHPVKAIQSRYNMCKQLGLSFKTSECGFRQLYELYCVVAEKIDSNPLLVDADDLLANPKEVMKHYCSATGLPFTEKMLTWKPNVVHEGWTTFRQSHAWFKNVAESCGFIKPAEEKVVTDYSILAPEVREVVEYSLPYYEALYPLRFKLTH